MSTPDFEKDPRPNPREVVTTKALTVWIAALSVYVGAIFGRTSFGVAGVEAIERFDVDASRIAVFASIQIGTYALAQVPTGILIDRFGPRRLLVIGAIIMGIGQLILGLTTSYGVAIGARVLIGAGDATAFLSVMRLLPFWFPLHRTPMFTAVTAAFGQLGQFLSAVPFLWLLHATGWTIAFVSLGSVVILIAIVAAIAVADSPESAGVYSEPSVEKDEPALSIGQRMKLALSSRATWQGFFIHYAGLHANLVCIMMWGVPMLTEAMGFSSAQAGMVLTINSIAMIIVSPFHGRLSSLSGRHRDISAFVLSLLHLLAWLWFFSSPSPRGLAVIIAMMILMALSSPSSNYGFDQIRETLDRNVVATATGLANMGGFTAGMIAAQIFGIMLDKHSGGTAFVWGDFRYAALAVLVVWTIGLLGILITRGGTRPRKIRMETVTED